MKYLEHFVHVVELCSLPVQVNIQLASLNPVNLQVRLKIHCLSIHDKFPHVSELC